jgi:hypothetical protein
LNSPGADAIVAWFNSPEYQALAEHRHAASTGSIALIKKFTALEGLRWRVHPEPRAEDPLKRWILSA